MDKENKVVGIQSVEVNIRLGYGDYSNVVDGAKGVIMKAAVKDSGGIMSKLDSPVTFYVTLLTYFEKRINLHRLFGHDDHRVLAVEFVHSSLKAEIEG